MEVCLKLVFQVFSFYSVDLSYVVMVKSTMEILQNFVAFSEYMNFNWLELLWVQTGDWQLQKTQVKNLYSVDFCLNNSKRLILKKINWKQSFKKIYSK